MYTFTYTCTGGTPPAHKLTNLLSCVCVRACICVRHNHSTTLAISTKPKLQQALTNYTRTKQAGHSSLGIGFYTRTSSHKNILQHHDTRTYQDTRTKATMPQKLNKNQTPQSSVATGAQKATHHAAT